MAGASGGRGDVCSGGGRLSAGGWGVKGPNLCLAAHESAALLDCVSPLPCLALAFPSHPATCSRAGWGSPHPKGHGGCGRAWLGARRRGRHPGQRSCVEPAAPRDAHCPPPVSPQVWCCCSQFSISRTRTKSIVPSARVERRRADCAVRAGLRAGQHAWLDGTRLYDRSPSLQAWKVLLPLVPCWALPDPERVGTWRVCGAAVGSLFLPLFWLFPPSLCRTTVSQLAPVCQGLGAAGGLVSQWTVLYYD